MARRILVVEDDETLRTGLADTLDLEGYQVTAVASGEAAEKLLFQRHFDLVVLDWMLPGTSGMELLRRLRAERLRTPVLLLTARDAEIDKVRGLESGADDYVTKPFSLRELLARIKALLRRVPGEVGPAGAPARFALGAVEVDLAAYRICRDGEEHALSPKEAAMLALLYARAGRVVRREDFLEHVWDGGELVGNRTIDTHILHLRGKLEADPRQPEHLQTVHGVGYRLILPPGT